MKNSIFFSQAQLLLKVLPIVNQQKVFALKGGTAINFFLRDLPRLSVDIDLTYLPVSEREDALKDITGRMLTISEVAKKTIPNTVTSFRLLKNTEYICGMYITSNGVSIKLEPNMVIRGTVYEPQIIELSDKAQEFFELSLKMQCLSNADLYGGKICAALDRQHPRDLFDVKLLFDNEGITDEIRKAFIAYLISHSRPIVEILNPGLLDMKQVYEQEFTGMTNENIPYEELVLIRARLISSIKELLTEEEIGFLLSFKAKNPDWKLLAVDGVDKLPAVRWKLQNLMNMDTKKHSSAYTKLEDYLRN